jgi:hypothetical protein
MKDLFKKKYLLWRLQLYREEYAAYDIRMLELKKEHPYTYAMIKATAWAEDAEPRESSEDLDFLTGKDTKKKKLMRQASLKRVNIKIPKMFVIPDYKNLKDFVRGMRVELG